MKSIQWVTAAVVAAAVCLGGCSKQEASKDDGATGKAAEAEQGGDTGGADGAKLEEAYQATFGDMNRKDGFDDKLKDLKAKIGEPQKTEGKDMFWWGWDQKNNICREVKIIQGAGGMLKMADKSKCGK